MSLRFGGGDEGGGDNAVAPGTGGCGETVTSFPSIVVSICIRIASACASSAAFLRSAGVRLAFVLAAGGGVVADAVAGALGVAAGALGVAAAGALEAGSAVAFGSAVAIGAGGVVGGVAAFPHAARMAVIETREIGIRIGR
jgi:hypothetical protein